MCCCCSFVLTEPCRRVLALFLTALHGLQIVAGLATLSTGAHLVVGLLKFSSILEGYHSSTLEHMLIGTGCVVMAVHGLAGFLTYRMSNIQTRHTSQRPWQNVMLYIVLLPLVLVIFVAANMTSSHKSRLEGTFVRGLMSAVHGYPDMDDQAKETVDDLQLTYSCCGVHGYQDWFDVPWSEPKELLQEHSDYDLIYHLDSVPSSCCDPSKASPCVHDNLAERDHGDMSVYTTGCARAVRDSLLEQHLKPASWIAWMMFLSEVFLLLLYRFLQTSCDIASTWGDPGQPAAGYLCGDPPAPPNPPKTQEDVEARLLAMEEGEEGEVEEDTQRQQTGQRYMQHTLRRQQSSPCTVYSSLSGISEEPIVRAATAGVARERMMFSRHSMDNRYVTRSQRHISGGQLSRCSSTTSSLERRVHACIIPDSQQYHLEALPRRGLQAMPRKASVRQEYIPTGGRRSLAEPEPTGYLDRAFNAFENKEDFSSGFRGFSKKNKKVDDRLDDGQGKHSKEDKSKDRQKKKDEKKQQKKEKFEKQRNEKRQKETTKKDATSKKKEKSSDKKKSKSSGSKEKKPTKLEKTKPVKNKTAKSDKPGVKPKTAKVSKPKKQKPIKTNTAKPPKKPKVKKVKTKKPKVKKPKVKKPKMKKPKLKKK